VWKREGVLRAVLVEISIVNTYSPFAIFLFYKDWVCQPLWVCDFSNKFYGQEPSNFYPNSLVQILSEATQPLLDGSCLFVEIQGVLSLFLRTPGMSEGFHAKMSQLARRKEVSFLCLVEPVPIRVVLFGLFSLRRMAFVSWSGYNCDSTAESFSRMERSSGGICFAN
jgi:hypothetical protein